MKINGHVLPIKDILVIGTFVFWLAGLSFQVNSNATDIEKQSDTTERLVKTEVTQESIKEDIREIKDEQKEHRKILDKILDKVSD